VFADNRKELVHIKLTGRTIGHAYRNIILLRKRRVMDDYIYVLCAMLDLKKPWCTCSFRAHLVNGVALKAKFFKEILMILGWAIWWHRNEVTFMGRVTLLREVAISFQREIQFYPASSQALFENGAKNLVMQFR
jgi:hypothetical protein